MTPNRIRDIWRQFSGRGTTYPHELAFLLTLPFRRLILSPEQLVDRLGLHENSRVLELGPGPGFFSVRVARSLPQGHLYLADIQIEMLRKARTRLARSGVSNASFVQASAGALPFAAGTLDVVFLVAVLGEVPDPDACVASIAQVLRSGGILSITELPGDPDALSEAEVARLACARGFERAETYPIRGGFTANFRKPAPAAPESGPPTG
ncbi:MAG TPA: methyltransferase domain-containing protein [Candidatus Binataceae bacterium]|nr:methyltransferase domain-containing protein [Candidatus Binataceae bacterium]